MKNRKGFTLVEIIIAMLISSIVLSIISSVFSVGLNSQKKGSEEFIEQAGVRYSVETINNSIRYSSVTFAVTEKDYKPKVISGVTSGLVKPWNYIGLNEAKTSLVHYIYDSATKEYKERKLATAQNGTTYKITFAKDLDTKDETLVRFILEGKDANGEKFKVNTELDALNSIHVVDWGDISNPSVALAYRTEDTPEINNRPIAGMTMVLDTSGSMTEVDDPEDSEYPGKANDTSPPSGSRIEILKRCLSTMISDLKVKENVYASLVPFSLTANIPNNNFIGAPKDPSKFRIINNDPAKLLVWDKLIKSLRGWEGTNTGDGMRRGYYQLIDFKELPEAKGSSQVLNYMVIMVDGQTNQYSSDYYNSYYIQDKRQITNAENGYYRGSTTGGEKYVNLMGAKIKSSPELKGNVYVIGFSSVPSDLVSVKGIADSVGIVDNPADPNYEKTQRIFIAKSEDDLKGVFKKIGDAIVDGLWQVEGPVLKKN